MKYIRPTRTQVDPKALTWSLSSIEPGEVFLLPGETEHVYFRCDSQVVRIPEGMALVARFDGEVSMMPLQTQVHGAAYQVIQG